MATRRLLLIASPDTFIVCTDEVARRFGVGPSTLYRYDLQSEKPPKTWPKWPQIVASLPLGLQSPCTSRSADALQELLTPARQTALFLI
jgi:hypothetical protein